MQNAPGPSEALTNMPDYEKMPADEIGFVLIGPSGAGKSTLRDYICAARDGATNYVKYLPLTTRLERPDEDGEYRFVTAEEMEDARNSPNAVFGNTSYGNEFLTLWPEKLLEGSHYLYIYLPEAAAKFKQTFQGTKIIQIAPANISELRDRIVSRDPEIDDKELSKRLNSVTDELSIGAAIADAVIINDNSIEQAAAKLQTILLALSNKA